VKTLRTIAAATRDALALAGLAAVAGFYAAERSWLWLLPATLLLCGIWYCVYKIREIVIARRSPLRAERARRAQGHPTSPALSLGGRAWGQEFVKPPKSAQRTYILTEGGVPVGVEYDRRAVENWLGLGPGFDFETREINS